LHFGRTKSPETRLVAAKALSILGSWGGAIAPSAPCLRLWRREKRFKGGCLGVCPLPHPLTSPHGEEDTSRSGKQLRKSDVLQVFKSLKISKVQTFKFLVFFNFCKILYRLYYI